MSAPVPNKRRKKTSDGTEDYREVPQETSSKTTVKKKPPPKMPTVFKAGKWNPDTEIVENETEKCGDSSEPDYSCCKLCNLRNLHRAVNTGNAVLLKKLILDKKNIAQMLSSWSKNCMTTLIHKIFEKKSLALLEVFYPTKEFNFG